MVYDAIYLAKSGVNLTNIPISYQYRQTGKVSIIKWRLWKVAILAGWQTLRYRLTFNKKLVPHSVNEWDYSKLDHS